MKTKQDIVEAISRLIGVHPAPAMSTGSTEPKAILLFVNDRLGLRLDPSLQKPELARGIVESTGDKWLPTYESRGGTVTKKGLSAVLQAVEFFSAD